jgi:hypothetical protein
MIGATSTTVPGFLVAEKHFNFSTSFTFDDMADLHVIATAFASPPD